MGESISVRCKKCNRKFEFMEGIGMLGFPELLLNSNDKLNILNYYEYGINKDELEKILKAHKHILKDGYGYKTYQCLKCKEIYNEFFFELESIELDGKDFLSQYLCHNCKEEMSIVNNIEKCPVCGGDFDKENMEFINWD